jgi:hypothetical protein
MFEDERGSYYAKDEADAVIADLNGHAEVWSAVAAVRAKRIAELEAASLEMTKAARHLMQQRDDAWSERDRLESERDAARADAERYRWLRKFSTNAYHWPDSSRPILVWQQEYGEGWIDRMDAAIDAARGGGA